MVVRIEEEPTHGKDLTVIWHCSKGTYM